MHDFKRNKAMKTGAGANGVATIGDGKSNLGTPMRSVAPSIPIAIFLMQPSSG